MNKQVRLYSYLKGKEYLHHHDEIFTGKCDRVRQLFILCFALLGVDMLVLCDALTLIFIEDRCMYFRSVCG